MTKWWPVIHSRIKYGSKIVDEAIQLQERLAGREALAMALQGMIDDAAALGAAPPMVMQIGGNVDTLSQ